MNKKKYKYEYQTVQWPYDHGISPPNAPSREEGWEKVWADIMIEGCFAVYRRRVSQVIEQ